MLTILLRFIALGTFVGGGVFLTVRDLASLHELPAFSQVLIAPFVAVFWSGLSWFLALPFGMFPAGMTGLGYWFVLSRFTNTNPSRPVRCLLAGSIGLGVALLFGLLFSFGTAPGSYAPLVNLLSWASACAAGGTLSSLLVGDRAYAEAFTHRDAVEHPA
jgi:hypothetical protein